METLLVSRRDSLTCRSDGGQILTEFDQAARTESTEPILHPQSITNRSIVNHPEPNKFPSSTLAEASLRGVNTSAVSLASRASDVDSGGIRDDSLLSCDMQYENCWTPHAAALERGGGEKRNFAELEEQNVGHTAEATSPRTLPSKIITLSYSTRHGMSDDGSAGGSIVGASSPREEPRLFTPNINKNSLRPSSTTHTDVSLRGLEVIAPSFSGVQNTDGNFAEPRSGGRTVPHKKGPRVKYFGRKREGVPKDSLRKQAI